MKKTLSILLCAVLMVAVAFTTVGCASREKNPNDLLTASWKDSNKENTDPGNQNAGIAVFKFSGEKEEDNKFNPVKVKNVAEWCALTLNLADKDLKNVKKLTITAKGPAETKVVLKLESVPDIEAPYKEISFNLKETNQTFEFDLSFANYDSVRAGLKQVVMFIGAGNPTFEGDVYISEFNFSKSDPIKENVLNEQNIDIKVPNIYDGVSETFDFNKTWRENDKDTYTAVTTGSNTVITVKNGATGSWKYVATTIAGDLKAFTKINLVIKGKAETRALIKIEGGGVAAIEKWIDFTGAEQTILWDGIKPENLPKDMTAKFLLFASPETQIAGDYEIQISKLELAK